MKFVALLSGGKDSIHSTLLSIRAGHRLICCAHLSPPPIATEESYMYQTAGSEVLRLQVEECLGVPLYTREIGGKSRDTNLVYQANDNDDGDEVEDLYLLLQEVLRLHPEIDAVSSGAILSTYQRTRIENVAGRLQLTSLAYLWRMGSQSAVLDAILADETMHAVLVRVACPPGLTFRHLGVSLRELRDGGVLDSLYDKWGMHVAGEGGEYETIVLDCELFRFGRLVLEETEVVRDEEGNGVGVLRILKCRVEKKDCGYDDNADGDTSCLARKSEKSYDPSIDLQRDISTRVQATTSSCNNHTLSIPSSIATFASIQAKPNIRIMRGGLCHISAITSPTSQLNIASSSNDSQEAQHAVNEFLSIISILDRILSSLSPAKNKPKHDIVFVHLYLSQISHFSQINAHYQQYFGMHCPPSRSCVGLGTTALPGGKRVMMDCIIQLGSGQYLRHGFIDNIPLDNAIDKYVHDATKNKHHALRKTLHVQSISNWGPVCIGPYSQANVLRSTLVFLAGMIGLIPQTMTLIQSLHDDVEDWEVQLYQSWRNAASVLDGLEDGGGKLDDCIGGLVYVSFDALKAVCSSEDESESISWDKLWSNAEFICNRAISDNGGIVMGSVDGVASTVGLDPNLYDEDGLLYGGYEDEETWREMGGASTGAVDQGESHVPLLMVCLQELPMNALAEVELICASRRAATCLEVWNGDAITEYLKRDNEVDADMDMIWNTGYDYPTNIDATIAEPQVHITSISRCLGIGCACISTVTADIDENLSLGSCNLDMDDVVSKMIDSAISSASPRSEAAMFDIHNVLNVRMYYVASEIYMKTNEKECCIGVNVVDDGTVLRTLLHSVLASKSKQQHDTMKAGKNMSSTIPAHTLVPVMGMHMSATDPTRRTFLAIQVTFVDMLRAETDMWIRHNRKYNT